MYNVIYTLRQARKTTSYDERNQLSLKSYNLFGC